MNEYNKIDKVLYHGSNTKDLKYLKPFPNKYYTIPASIFLSNKKSVAKNYGDYIYRIRVKMDNIKIKEFDVYGESFHTYISFESKIMESYQDGYDIVIFKNIMDSKEPGDVVPLSDVYVFFKPLEVNF